MSLYDVIYDFGVFFIIWQLCILVRCHWWNKYHEQIIDKQKHIEHDFSIHAEHIIWFWSVELNINFIKHKSFRQWQGYLYEGYMTFG